MKTTLKILAVITFATLGLLACKKDLEDTDVWNGMFRNMTQQNARSIVLEELCRQQNTNIEGMQTIIEIYEQGQTISGIVPIIENGDTIGWNLGYGSGEIITIYQNAGGSSAPTIGVKQDTDGIYYWTLDGEWILGDNGEKMRVTGENGMQGITPQLKIEDDKWYISYNNGGTWTLVGDAKGEKGESMFQNITYDSTSITFTLADGTQVTVPYSTSGGGTTGISGTENGHDYVDMGTGVLWATCNVGARKPEDYGNYYAWGETTTKCPYGWATYLFSNDGGGSIPNLTKYCYNSSKGYNGFTDTKTVLDLADDAARANWGGNWRMPTKEECQALVDNCVWAWVICNGKTGFQVTATNGNILFLPAAGLCYLSMLMSYAGERGYYWSNSLSEDNTCRAGIISFVGHKDYGYTCKMGTGERDDGMPIRAVCNR